MGKAADQSIHRACLVSRQRNMTKTMGSWGGGGGPPRDGQVHDGSGGPAASL